MASNDEMPAPYGMCEKFRIDISSLPSEETYNPIQASVDIYTGFKTLFRCLKHVNHTSSPMNFFSDFAKVGSVTATDVYIVAIMTIVWTVSRSLLGRLIFAPFAKFWKMPTVNAEKFPESAFKTIAYFVLWASAMYVTFFSEHDFFNKSLSLWKDCKFKFGSAPLDLSLVYGLEASFYFHSIYATIFMDTWRRDSIAMLLHHVITLILVGFAYSVRYLKIGILIFVLNDLSDVLLEFGKCCVYLKIRGSPYANLWNCLSTVSSSLFALSWVVFRNLFHLTKVWRSAAYGTFVSAPYLPTPFHFFFNALLGILYLFYLYWFYFIAVFIFRILTGKMKEVDDIRDHEVEESFSKSEESFSKSEESFSKSESSPGYAKYKSNGSSVKSDKKSS